MTKQQTKNASRKNNKTQSPNRWMVIAIASLAVNAVLLLLIVSGLILQSSGKLDYAVINKGINTLCSDEFRNTISKNSASQDLSEEDQRDQLINLDYQCQKNGAEAYYQQGFENYRDSLKAKN